VSGPVGVTRVVVTGSESAGKTSLASALAAALHVAWVPEFARAYAESTARPLDAADVAPIARGQVASENAAIARARDAARPLVVLDTDLVSTTVYAEHYYGSCPEWIRDAARARLGDLYLLCLPDLPWEADGVRDQPLARRELHQRFRRRLEGFGALVLPVYGAGEARLAVAHAAIRGWRASRV
jgi:NadR type nicotinamide-nucleotide adenylyltransferase